MGTASPFSTDKWAEKIYAAIGRVKTVTTKPDNAMVTTDYSGSKVLITDQAGKKRMSNADALGRLTDVWEITPADASPVTVPFQGGNYAAYPSNYLYDTLGNLRTVTQAASQTTQTRTFVYDSLGRLTSATHPESGTSGYTPADEDRHAGRHDHVYLRQAEPQQDDLIRRGRNSDTRSFAQQFKIGTRYSGSQRTDRQHLGPTAKLLGKAIPDRILQYSC